LSFFEHQRKARNKSFWLIALFIMAVVCISTCVTAAFVLSFYFYELHDYGPFDVQLFGTLFLEAGAYVFPANFVLIGGASLWRMLSLGSDGMRLAISMGAVPLGNKDPKAKMLRNVVEEMAIASGVPAPIVMVLPDQASINAFAAGGEISDAVIGVTQGFMDQLSRDEMQAVIAHEYSHILNADMKLNMRLVGVIFGILMLSHIGEILLRSTNSRGSRSKGAGGIVIFGLLLFVLGLIGVFFAEWIKSLIAHQREYLADASSVQFTRNPQALGSVFHKMQMHSSHLSIPQLGSFSHFFFGSVKSLNFFPTHPPIHKRIKALEKMGYSPLTTKRNPKIAYEPSQPAAKQIDSMQAAKIVATLSLSLDDGDLTQRKSMETILGLLALHSKENTTLANLDPSLISSLKELPEDHYLYAVERSLNELSQMHKVEAQRFIMRVENLVFKDGVLSAFECAVLNILRRRLNLMPEKKYSRYTLNALRSEIILALQLVAEASSEEHSAKARAAVQFAQLFPDAKNAPLLSFVPRPQGKIVDRMFTRLSHCTIDAREKIMAALVATAPPDQSINTEEKLLLQAFAVILDAPLVLV
jgi:Zn-dependent protease with chaperone function